MILNIVFAIEILTSIWHNLNFDILNHWGWKNAGVKSTRWHHTLIKWFETIIYEHIYEQPKHQNRQNDFHSSHTAQINVHEISIPFGVFSTRHTNWHLTAKQKSQNYKQNMTSAENKRVGATNKTWHRLIDLSQVKCCWCAGCIDCQKRSLHGWLLYIFWH